MTRFVMEWISIIGAGLIAALIVGGYVIWAIKLIRRRPKLYNDDFRLTCTACEQSSPYRDWEPLVGLQHIKTRQVRWGHRLETWERTDECPLCRNKKTSIVTHQPNEESHNTLTCSMCRGLLGRHRVIYS